MFIIHINSNTVAFNKFTVARFQQRGQKEYELEPDAIIYRDGDYVYCFVNSLLQDRSYIMHGQMYKFDPLTLDVKYSDQVFDNQNWGWFPQSVGRDVNGRELVKHWSSDGYHWVFGDSEIKDKEVPRRIASVDFKIYQTKKSEDLLPAANPSDVINRIVRLVVKNFDRR